jgi:hypothetical protein
MARRPWASAPVPAARRGPQVVAVDLLPCLRRARDHIDQRYQQTLELDELAGWPGCRSSTSLAASRQPRTVGRSSGTTPSAPRLPARAGSPGSRVALMLLLYALPSCPQTMSAFANASFSGGGPGSAASRGRTCRRSAGPGRRATRVSCGCWPTRWLSDSMSTWCRAWAVATASGQLRDRVPTFEVSAATPDLARCTVGARPPDTTAMVRAGMAAHLAGFAIRGSLYAIPS